VAGQQEIAIALVADQRLARPIAIGAVGKRGLADVRVEVREKPDAAIPPLSSPRVKRRISTFTLQSTASMAAKRSCCRGRLSSTPVAGIKVRHPIVAVSSSLLLLFDSVLLLFHLPG
jgi:hypothetical protein